MKTCKDVYYNGRWLQRTMLNGKYTWTNSGVMWNNVKERCKAGSRTQKREPVYIGAVNNFTDFEAFTNWHMVQIGYGLGYELDSDILRISQNKVYSKDTCLLIPGALNRFLQKRTKRVQKLPEGVYEYRNKLFVRLVFKDDDGQNVFKEFAEFSLDKVKEASELYTTGVEKCAKIWANRLRDKSRYTVDERVITFMEDWKYV